MNGGDFFYKHTGKPPHKSHKTGNDADGVFADGFDPNSAETARRLLALLNDPTIGRRIACVLTTQTRTAGNEFWQAIKDVELADGRTATDVMLHADGHADHFHLRITDQGDRFYRACPKHLDHDMTGRDSGGGPGAP